MKWLERACWLAIGLGIGSWTVPFCDFVTQAVLGHSPLDPVHIPKEIQ